MDKQDFTLELHKGDGLLAVLRNIEPDDWPWYRCDFHAAAAFEQYRPLFDAELRLLETEGANDEWDKAYGKIEDLHLSLVDPSEARSTDLFILHVEGNQARFRTVFE